MGRLVLATLTLLTFVSNMLALRNSSGVAALGARVPSVRGPARERSHLGISLCSEELCSVEPAAPARNVTASAVATPVPAPEGWWKASAHLWHEVHTEEQYARAVSDPDFELVLVDWFATWCKGCKRTYPELCKMAASDTFHGKVKFVKVCVENLKALSKRERVNVLPYVSLHRPSYGRLLGFQAVPSKLPLLRKNVHVALQHPDKFFALDPNGFVKVLDEDPSEEQSRRKSEAQALESASSGLHNRLMEQERSGSLVNAPSGVGPPAMPSVDEAKPALEGAAAAANGNGNGNGAGVATLSAAKAAFLAKWGDQYGYKNRIDELYRKEVGCRMAPNEHYLDYTGSSLYTSSALRAAYEDLQNEVFGNPHSVNPSSRRSSDRIEEVRDIVLRWFNADPAEYQVVFTKSATGALKMTGETFPWNEGSVFRYTRVNHNSVLGIREYALQHGGRFQAVEDEWVEDWISGHKEAQQFLHPVAGTAAAPTFSLFAFPAEDNFSGVKYPLRWVKEIQGMSTAEHRWKVLLDAAAYVPTQPLDLSVVPADFVAVSFYKMFGYPTGLGALIVRTENVDLLRKVFWGGGTVALATSSDNFHVLKCRPSDKLEDGTVAFLDIINLKHMFAFAEQLGGVGAIHAHVHALTRYFYERLSGLAHSNGRKLALVFGNHAHPSPEEVQGGIVNFEVLDPRGQVFSYRTVETDAADEGFHIRAGVLCNPGAAYRDVGVTEQEVETLAEDKEGCGDEVDFIEVQRPVKAEGVVSNEDIMQALNSVDIQLGHPGEVAMKWIRKPLGSVRASLGYMSTFEDVEEFCKFIERKYKDRPVS